MAKKLKAGIDSSEAVKGAKEVNTALESMQKEARDSARDMSKSGDKIEDAFDDMQKEAKESSKSMVESLSSLKNPALAIVAAVAAVGAASFKAAEDLDEIGKAASRLDVSAGYFQQLEYASGQTGTSFDAVKTSIKDLTLRMGQANDGNKKTQEAFDDLGISLIDAEGKTRSVEAVYKDTIAALQDLDTASERSAKGQLLMGESVTQLGNITKQTSQDFRDLTENAKGIIPDEAFEQAAEFQDAWDDLTRTVGAEFQTSIADTTIPALTSLFKTMESVAKDGITPLIKSWFNLNEAQSLNPATAQAVIDRQNELNGVMKKGIEGNNELSEAEQNRIAAQNEAETQAADEFAALEASKLLQVQALGEAVKLYAEEQRTEKTIADALANQDQVANFRQAELDKIAIAKKATQDRINLEIGAAKTIANSLSVAASVFKDQSAQAFKIYQATAATETSIATAQAVMTTFKTYGATPWGYAAAGAVGLAGAAKVHQILAMSPGSTGGGGAPSGGGGGVSGGGGGISPAQQITDLAPTQEQVQPQPINIYVAGMTDAEAFERNVLPSLTEHLSNGGTIFDENSAQVQIIQRG